MLDDKVTIIGNLKIHLEEISAAVVRINETRKGALRKVARGTSVRNDKRSFSVVEVGCVAHFGFGLKGKKSDCCKFVE